MSSSNKKNLILMGLICTSCASKIEDKINNLSDVKNAYINFTSQKLVLEVYKEKDLERVIKKAKEIVNEIEPDVKVIDESKNEKKIEKTEPKNKIKLIRISTGAIIFFISLLSNFSYEIKLLLFLTSYILIGGDILIKSFKNILKGQVFDENFLMSIATIGAFSIGESPEGVAVMLFYQIGEFFQDLAVNRSRTSIKSLMDIRPDYANLKVNENIKKVSPEDVNINDHIVIKPGEKVPLDGTVIKGTSLVDTSALTGESVPKKLEAGEEILSGFINKDGVITVKVTKKYKESTVSKILDLVENASGRKAPTEQFITKFSRYYTPVVVILALLITIIPSLIFGNFSTWLYRALIFLVISCPCALVVSIPLGFFGGIGAASKNGILVKGGNYLEALNNVDISVFDKTGTLTEGNFSVTEINSKIPKDELLKYAALAESYSNHPIATSIVKAFDKNIDKTLIKNYKEISGHGIKADIMGKEVLIGNHKLMEEFDIAYEKTEDIGTIIYVSIDKEYVGYIVISDKIKKDSYKVMYDLKNEGVRKNIMLTGDNKKVGEKVSSLLKLDKVYSELLPHEKVEKLENILKEKKPNKKLLFVGDGINDAPVLARADIGVAMGGLGSDAAIEAADVVLMTDEPSKLVTAIKIANRTKKIVLQNIVFALSIKAIVLLLGAFGQATMWAAVFADVGVALIAILNSLRVLKTKNI
ncbi:MAG: cadmium-translocating P-type ATPase [Firmicutes bacterium]|nr:cadmium-translocating P-type ATPase [Bacillota bacterium]